MSKYMSIDDFFSTAYKIADTLLDVTIGNIDNASEMEREVLATFYFGMLNAFGIESLNLDINTAEKPAPAIIAGANHCALVDKFKYDDVVAKAFTCALIKYTDRKVGSTYNAIIHRGIEGYFMWKEKRYDQLTKEFKFMMDLIKEYS